MSPDRQALLSLYHDDATALLDRALQAQHEPEGLHVVHAALVEALADAHTDGREPSVSTTVPDETIEAIQARAGHSAALPDVTDEHESPADCRRCHTSLHLLDGCEWPADGPLCGTCTDDERLEAIADRAALLAEVRRLTDALAREEQAHGLTIDQREACHTAADSLAYAIAPVELIGEHSNLNDPWANAEEALEVERRNHAAALATARLDGARVMLDKVREIASSIDLAAGAEELADTLNGTICALDPAAVVGSGS